MRRLICTLTLLLTLAAPGLGQTVGSNRGIMWGVSAHPLKGGVYTSIPLVQQMLDLKKAGLKSYRVDLYNIGQAGTLAQVIAAAKTAGIEVLPTLMPLPNATTDENSNYQIGYTMGSTYAAQFEKDIQVWELGNEIEIWVGTNGSDGSNFARYNQARYPLARGMIRGLLDGIHAANPASQGLVNNAGWCHYGLQVKLWSDGVHWDITGEHWYDSGGDLQHANCGHGVNILQLLHDNFGKPIWITEYNDRTAATSADKSGMATWLTNTMMEWNNVANKYDIEGAQIYELYDEANLSGVKAHMGIMDKSGNVTAAYTAVQSFLAAHPSVAYSAVMPPGIPPVVLPVQ